MKVRMTLENDMFMDIELYPEIAPKTVENFLKYVDDGFYDGIVFHRIIKGFMAQVGGYTFNQERMEIGEKEATYPSITGEFKSNGFENNLLHEKGVISMARTMIKNSATSQIFIMTARAPHLDGEYAAFGKVVNEEGMKCVEYLNGVRTVNVGGGLTDFPYPVVRIKKVERI